MESLQRELAATATFADDHGIDPAVVAIDEPADLTDGLPDARQETLPGTRTPAIPTRRSSWDRSGVPDAG